MNVRKPGPVLDAEPSGAVRRAHRASAEELLSCSLVADIALIPDLLFADNDSCRAAMSPTSSVHSRTEDTDPETWHSNCPSSAIRVLTARAAMSEDTYPAQQPKAAATAARNTAAALKSIP